MARLQILELPEGSSDDRPPFILVIDEVTEDESGRVIDSKENLDGMAKAAGAHAVAVFHGMTITIPANEPQPVNASDGRRRCSEHEGPCFPEPGATCVAHGDVECLRCHRNPADCADGGDCGTWARTGMHWDTCANRVRGPLASGAVDGQQTAELVDAHERTRLKLCDALLLSRDTTWHQIVEQAAERQRTMARLFRQLGRVRELPDYPDLMDSRQEHPAVWKHGYQCGVLAAKSAARNERATVEGGG